MKGKVFSFMRDSWISRIRLKPKVSFKPIKDVGYEGFKETANDGGRLLESFDHNTA